MLTSIALVVHAQGEHIQTNVCIERRLDSRLKNVRRKSINSITASVALICRIVRQHLLFIDTVVENKHHCFFVDG